MDTYTMTSYLFSYELLLFGLLNSILFFLFFARQDKKRKVNVLKCFRNFN